MDCIRRMDVTWVVSPYELEVLAREVPQATVMIQTNIHYPVERAVPFAEREGIMFVGGYRHPPNVDAALFYCREIVPRLRERLPGVVSYLIGSNPPPAVGKLEGDGIEVLGYVPEIEPWFDKCRLSVSPLRYGAGVKGKINHSMSRGLPVVATAVSVEGMHLVEGEEVLVADDPDASIATRPSGTGCRRQALRTCAGTSRLKPRRNPSAASSSSRAASARLSHEGPLAGAATTGVRRRWNGREPVQRKLRRLRAERHRRPVRLLHARAYR
jgi:hypothetical protein